MRLCTAATNGNVLLKAYAKHSVFVKKGPGKVPVAHGREGEPAQPKQEKRCKKGRPPQAKQGTAWHSKKGTAKNRSGFAFLRPLPFGFVFLFCGVPVLLVFHPLYVADDPWLPHTLGGGGTAGSRVAC